MRRLPEAELDKISFRRPAINEGTVGVREHYAGRTDLKGGQT